MALEHTPLDPTQLSPAVQRALAPGPARLMAARGLAPLPRPGDLVTVLYQLAVDPEPAIAQAAKQAAHELPERVLDGALGDEALDPRVLDYFAALVRRVPALLQRVLLNRATADQTITDLAAHAGAAAIDIIAQNEERLLRHPAIIGSMFNNPQARMSTVDRALELAVRNNVPVPNVPAWEAMVKAILGNEWSQARSSPGETDSLFARAAQAQVKDDAPANDPEAESKTGDETSIADMTIPQKIRLATLGNSFARSVLIRSAIRIVAVAAIKAPGVTDIEAAKYAGNHSLCDDVIHHIANRRDWTKSYGVKLSLVQNPKTPIPAAIRLMPHLRERDLRNIARSKGISSAVVAQARKLLMQRQKGTAGKR